eukprot:SAG31_NODE_2521_length_5566_cov_2.201939_2_plen_108_part_00
MPMVSKSYRCEERGGGTHMNSVRCLMCSAPVVDTISGPKTAAVVQNRVRRIVHRVRVYAAPNRVLHLGHCEVRAVLPSTIEELLPIVLLPIEELPISCCYPIVAASV